LKDGNRIHPGSAKGDITLSLRIGYRCISRSIGCSANRLKCLRDCLEINERTGVTVLFACFHHSCLNNGDPLREAALQAWGTWRMKGGGLMIDYSEPAKGKRAGTHAEGIDVRKFEKFPKAIAGIDADIMLEIKDKGKSALLALDLIDHCHKPC